MPTAGGRLPGACSRMRFAYPGYGAARWWSSADLGEAARAAVRSPDKAEGRIRGRSACQSRADACREPVPGCASLVRAARLRVRGVQSTWAKRRGPQFVARIRPKAASGGAHANRGRTPAGSLFPDALRLSGLRGYALVAFSRPGRSGEAAVRSPDKAEGRIRGGACQSRDERLPEACSRMRFAYPGYYAARRGEGP